MTAGTKGTAPRAVDDAEGWTQRAGPLPRIAVVLIVTAALTITLAGMRATAEILGPAVLALVLTITVHPVRRVLVRWGWPDWVISLVVVVTVYLMLLAVTLAIGYSIGRLAVLVPEYVPDLEDAVANTTEWLQDRGVGGDQVDALTNAFDFGSVVPLIGSIFGAAASVLSDLFFIVTLALFMAFDTRGTQRVFARLWDRRPYFVDALTHFTRGTRTYMAVSATFGFIVAVIDGVALELLGVPGAFVWAVLAFVTNFIPNIGFVLGLIPPAILGLLEGGPSLMLAVLAVYSVINVVIQSIIQPRIVGDAVGLSPTITMLSLVFWAWVLGPLGALLAVPLSLLVRALLIEADPRAAWALPLVSGRLPPEPAPEPAPVATDDEA